MYPFSRHTKCSRSCFSYPTIGHRYHSTSVHSDPSLFGVFGFFVVVFFLFCFSGFPPSKCRVGIQNFSAVEPLSQSLSLTRWGPHRSWTHLATKERTQLHPHPSPLPTGPCQHVSPAFIFAFQKSQKAKLPTWLVRRGIQLA